MYGLVGFYVVLHSYHMYTPSYRTAYYIDREAESKIDAK